MVITNKLAEVNSRLEDGFQIIWFDSHLPSLIGYAIPIVKINDHPIGTSPNPVYHQEIQLEILQKITKEK